MNNFKSAPFNVRRISSRGAWLVTCRDAVDLGLLFLRPQEFVECINPKFRGQQFTFTDFVLWHVKRNKRTHKVSAFDYFEQFEGFNIASADIERFLSKCPPESPIDWKFRSIIASITKHEKGKPFYLIGALDTAVATTDHEIAHAMFNLCPKYREAADALVRAADAADRTLVKKALMAEGYVDDDYVLMDEMNAYMATGVLEAMSSIEQKRVPFMQLFAQHKAEFLDL